MKRSVFLAAIVVAIGVGAFAANLGDTHTIYLLPMSSGLDQYLAVGLTKEAVLQVVTDPQKADAVFTDHLGETLESKFDELYGVAKKVDPKADGKSEGGQTFSRVQSVSRARGAVFLVDRKTREVIWGVYDRPKDGSPGALKRSADRIVSKLAKAIKPNKS